MILCVKYLLSYISQGKFLLRFYCPTVSLVIAPLEGLGIAHSLWTIILQYDDYPQALCRSKKEAGHRPAKPSRGAINHILALSPRRSTGDKSGLCNWILCLFVCLCVFLFVLCKFSNFLQCSTVQYGTVQYITVWYSAIKYSTVQYSTV